jgi:hypothetical protein
MKNNRVPFRFRPLPLCVFASLLLACSIAVAQTSGTNATDTVPDAPSTTLAVSSSASSTDDALQQPGVTPQNQGAATTHGDPQQKRIFGIVPNFRAVTAGTILPQQTVKDKFKTASEDSFDYSAVIVASLVALEAYGANNTPEFGKGGVGYSRYLWHSFADQTSENIFVEFLIPSITHEDTRYYSLGRGGFSKRAIYALSRAFITKTDSGKTTFNASEVIGAGAAAGISNLYYPGPERTVSNTIDKWGTSIGIDVAGFFVREFYPDIYHHVFHKNDTP